MFLLFSASERKAFTRQLLNLTSVPRTVVFLRVPVVVAVSKVVHEDLTCCLSCFHVSPFLPYPMDFLSCLSECNTAKVTGYQYQIKTQSTKTSGLLRWGAVSLAGLLHRKPDSALWAGHTAKTGPGSRGQFVDQRDPELSGLQGTKPSQRHGEKGSHCYFNLQRRWIATSAHRYHEVWASATREATPRFLTGNCDNIGLFLFFPSVLYSLFLFFSMSTGIESCQYESNKMIT